MLVRSATIVALLSLTISTASCGASRPNGTVALETEEASYQAGDSVVLRLINESSANVGYNICFAYVELEMQMSDTWHVAAVDLGPEENSACTAELRGLNPGDAAESTIYLPETLEAGTYRLRHDVEMNGERHAVRTSSFEVRAG